MSKNSNFLQFSDLSKKEYLYLFKRTKILKENFVKNINTHTLKNKTFVMIFEKSSTRTRLSFEIGMHQMGGNAIFLDSKSSQFGRGEPIDDSAKVISRMCHLIMMRTYEHDIIELFAKNSKVPVINGLTNDFHPCQILSDIYTFIEKRGNINDKIVTWIGDINNVCKTWIQAAKVFGFKLNISSPPKYKFKLKNSSELELANVEFYELPEDAIKDSDLVTTDVWTSMGFEKEKNERKADFIGWQVNKKIMNLAKRNAIFMHCLPAHRGEEVTAEVIDGERSVVWDEAENRLHTQKALMEFLLIGQVNR